MPSNIGGDNMDPEYNPHVRKTRKPKTPLMKKQVKKAAKIEVPWMHRAKDLPLALFHTTVGPIIGRLDGASREKSEAFKLRLWAPAVVRVGLTPGQAPDANTSDYAVTFQPIALVETHIDLSTMTPFGRSPVPEAIVPAYEAFFDKVAAGEYSLTRTMAKTTQAAPHVSALREWPFPWPEDSDHYAWLTRKVYELPDDEVVARDDQRRVLVKRTLYGRLYDASVDKIASNFDLSPFEVRRVSAAIDKAFPGLEEHKARLRELISKPAPGVVIDETSTS